MDKRVSKNWKTTAIILIVVVTLYTLLFVWAIITANDMVNKENECIFNVCGDDKYDSYSFDEYTNICKCFDGKDLGKTEYIR